MSDDAERPNGAVASEMEDETTEQPSPQEVAAQLEQFKRDAADMLDTLQRTRAEFANYRRRIEQEQARQRERATEQLVLRLLPVADDFDRALKAVPEDVAASTWVEGMRMVERKLWQALESVGVSVMSSVGEPFDPSRHEAIMVDEDAATTDTVVEEFQRGYLVNESILRPAMVKVGAAPVEPSHDASRAS